MYGRIATVAGNFIQAQAGHKEGNLAPQPNTLAMQIINPNSS